MFKGSFNSFYFIYFFKRGFPHKSSVLRLLKDLKKKIKEAKNFYNDLISFPLSKCNC